MHSHKFKDTVTALRYMLAGNARITVVSLNSGVRFTFRVRQPKKNSPHFVGVLTGSDNETAFTYLGTIFQGTTYSHGRKSPISRQAKSAQAWEWLWASLQQPIVPGQIPAACEVWRENRCGRCSRPLTVPSSIESGLGPECEGKAA